MKGNPQALWTEVVLEKSQRKEIPRQIPFISFSISVRLILPCKFMRIKTYNVPDSVAYPYWQKHWHQHLFLRGLWDCGNWLLLLEHHNQVLRCWKQNNWLCSCSTQNPWTRLNSLLQPLLMVLDNVYQTCHSLIFVQLMEQGKEQWWHQTSPKQTW